MGYGGVWGRRKVYNSNMTAGIDIGGTKIRWVLLDARGKVAIAREFATPRGSAAISAALCGLFSDLKKRGVVRVGVGIASSLSGTVVRHAPNISGLDGVNFNTFVLPGIIFKIDNDARCFARAEAAFIKGGTSKRVFAVTLGTGIGRAVVSDGAVERIKRFEDPEPWEGNYKKHANEKAGPLAALIGAGLAPVLAKMEPDVVVIGGGRMRTPKLFYSLRKELREQGITCAIRRSRMKQNAGAYGAALLAAGK
jgi:predicted NBD/HSP70 family sugar kinase